MQVSQEELIKHRQAFEEFFSKPPFEYNMERWTCDFHQSPWPGQYKDNITETAWIAFLEGITNK